MNLTAPRIAALDGLPRNARSAILLEPLWAVFGVVILYYAPLYMTGVGLSSTQVGLVGSVGLAASFVFQTLAATITNRVGRRRTTLAFDIVSWTLPMLIWAFAGGLAAFLVAAVLNAAVRVAAVSWSLLVIEDVDPADRPRVFGILNLVVAACGLATPVVGLVTSRFGVVPTLRVYYFLGAIGMTVMFLWRNAKTAETRNGLAAMREHAEMRPWESLASNLRHLAAMWRRPGLPWLVSFYVLTVFIEQLNLFQVLYFSETLAFGAVAVSLVPVATAAVIVLVYGVVMRRLSSAPAEQALVLTSLLALLGAVLVVLVPKGNLPFLLAVVCVLSGAAYLVRTYRDAVLFSRLPEGGTADLFSAVQALTMLFSIPAAGIAGLIFAAQPVALFALVAALNAALVGLAVAVARAPSDGRA